MSRTIRNTIGDSALTLANRASSSRPPSGRPVFVAGNGRSGTSWIARTLSLADNTLYYLEPCRPAIHGYEGEDADRLWAQHVSQNGDHPQFREWLGRAFEGQIFRGSGLRREQIFQRLWSSPRVIVKDVAAFASVEWVSKNWDPDVVVIFRHPAACVASVRRQKKAVGELNRLRFLIAQPDVQHLIGSKVAAFCSALEDPLFASVASWAVRAQIVLQDAKANPDWTVVHYEDFAANPIESFHELFGKLDLPWTAKVEDAIRVTSTTERPGLYSTSRVSASKITAWKQHLTAADIAGIRDVLAVFDLPIYISPDNWQGPFKDDPF